jgi:hypothetical protein
MCWSAVRDAAVALQSGDRSIVRRFRCFQAGHPSLCDLAPPIRPDGSWEIRLGHSRVPLRQIETGLLCCERRTADRVLAVAEPSTPHNLGHNIRAQDGQVQARVRWQAELLPVSRGRHLQNPTGRSDHWYAPVRESRRSGSRVFIPGYPEADRCLLLPSNPRAAGAAPGRPALHRRSARSSRETAG